MTTQAQIAPVFLGDWKNPQGWNYVKDEHGRAMKDASGRYMHETFPIAPIDQLKSDFEITDKDLEGVEILLAWYGHEQYDGTAFALFRSGEYLFEVHGSHCSCYGLEGQWTPEATSLEGLLHRLGKGELGRQKDYNKPYPYPYMNVYAKELGPILRQLQEEGYR